MNPVEILSEEHKYILLTVECLAQLVDEGIRMQKLNFLRAEEIVNFFRNFADKWHHCKEEDTLFPLMDQEDIRGVDGIDYIDDLESEHVKARSHVKGMDDSFREAAHGDMKEVMEFARHAREYIDLIKGHILKEDRIVFPFAAENLSGNALAKLPGEFKGAEEKLPEEHSGEVYREQALKLAHIYNVEVPADISDM